MPSEDGRPGLTTVRFPIHKIIRAINVDGKGIQIEKVGSYTHDEPERFYKIINVSILNIEGSHIVTPDILGSDCEKLNMLNVSCADQFWIPHQWYYNGVLYYRNEYGKEVRYRSSASCTVV